MNRSNQPRHVYFGNIAAMPASAVDSLAMAAVESGAACAARLLLHHRMLKSERTLP